MQLTTQQTTLFYLEAERRTITICSHYPSSHWENFLPIISLLPSLAVEYIGKGVHWNWLWLLLTCFFSTSWKVLTQQNTRKQGNKNKRKKKAIKISSWKKWDGQYSSNNWTWSGSVVVIIITAGEHHYGQRFMERQAVIFWSTSSSPFFPVCNYSYGTPLISLCG